MKSLYGALPTAKRGVWFEDAQEAAAHVAGHLDSGDVVLAKGSLSTKLGLVVDAIRKMGHAPLELE